MVTPIKQAYVAAASSVATLLGEPAIVRRWAQPSALKGFPVSGLAGHLASQVLSVPRVLAAPVPDGDVVALLDHYARVRWIGADVDAQVNVSIRDAGEAIAAEGPAALLTRVEAVVGELPALLSAQPLDRLVSPPAGPWGLVLDDFLVTRMMEIVVHSDDLACSVEVATPVLPDGVVEPVIALLSSLAVRRHGATAVVRALSRAERAPASIAAF